MTRLRESAVHARDASASNCLGSMGNRRAPSAKVRCVCQRESLAALKL